jgi:hypothetical protein
MGSWYPLAKLPPSDADYIDMMRRCDLWPAHAWLMREETALAVVNRHTRALGVIFNIPWRDRLTVFELMIFDREHMLAILTPGADPGVPEHKYHDYEAMFDAGWWPD